MTSNPTSEGLVERLSILAANGGLTRFLYERSSTEDDAADFSKLLALVTSLRNQLEGAKEALRRVEKIARSHRAGSFHSTWVDGLLAVEALAASTLYGLEGKQEVSLSQSQPCGDGAPPILPPVSEPSGRWRKRPVVVDAWRVQDFASAQQQSDPAKWNAQPAWLRKARLDGRIVTTPSTVIVKTVEGDMRAQRSDWIIRGVYGEIYPCKPDIFAATYEPETYEPASPDGGDPLTVFARAVIENVREEIRDEVAHALTMAAVAPLSAHLDAERQPEPREAHEKLGEDE